MRPEGVDGRSVLEWVWNGGVASLMRSQMPWRGVVGVFILIYIGDSRPHTITDTIYYRGGKTLRRNDKQSAEKDDEGARSPGLLVGGCFRVTSDNDPLVSDDRPRQRSITHHAKRITSCEALIGGPNRANHASLRSNPRTTGFEREVLP